MQHKPKDTTPEKFKESWENLGAALQPLADVLLGMRDALNTVKADDFDCPNHYTKLVSEQMQRQLIDKILDLFPKSVDK
jgi:hypothetical protein